MPEFFSRIFSVETSALKNQIASYLYYIFPQAA